MEMLTKNNILTKLFEQFKTFEEKMRYEPDELLPYNVIGDFALNFQKKLIAANLTTEEIDKFFNFVNEMADSLDEEVQNILVVEIFEIFSDEEETIKIAKKRMNDKGRQLLERTLKGWI